MARILITSGPTREHLDPVRYLSNASSGRMGAALAEAVLRAGHQAVIVSGPVEVGYPPGAQVCRVQTTEEMLAAAQKLFPKCAGLIAAAAPCDFRPRRYASQKLQKKGRPLLLELVETPDVVATLAAQKKPSQWLVAFALETNHGHRRALQKLRRKGCDLIVLNGPESLHSSSTKVEVLGGDGRVLASFRGRKQAVAAKLFSLFCRELMNND